jgi:hypothetical protein
MNEKFIKVIGIDVDEKLHKEITELQSLAPAYSKGGLRREVLKLGIEQFKLRIKSNGTTAKKPIQR